MISYIKRHWKGENSLAWAYWVNGAFLNVIVAVAITTLSSETKVFDDLVPWILMVIGTMSIGVWSMVGIWRSANRSIERAQVSSPRKSAFWAYAAKVMVILGVFQLVAAWLPVLKDIKTAFDLSESDIATQFYLQHQGETDVILNGYINSASVEAVKKAFNANKQRNALVLNSPGGILVPAYDLADFVEERAILVAARGECVSSCLLVLAAASKAYVTPDTRLVFHHPEALADFVSEGMAVELVKETREYYSRFKRYGVPPNTLAEYRRQGLKVISIGEAYNSYIVDAIWDPTTNEFFEIEATCKQTDCFISPMKLP